MRVSVGLGALGVLGELVGDAGVVLVEDVLGLLVGEPLLRGLVVLVDGEVVLVDGTPGPGPVGGQSHTVTEVV